MEHIYHVTTSANIADIPTRPDRFSLADIPSGPKDMISRVEELYESWFRVYNNSLLPQLISQTAPK